MLTLLGIMLGSAAIVFLASALSGASIALARTSQSISGGDISRVEYRVPGPSEASRTSGGLSDADLRALRRHDDVPDHRSGASNSLMGQDASFGQKVTKVGVSSGISEYASLSSFELQHGRLPLPSEDGARVCVIGSAVFKELFDDQWPLPENGIVIGGVTRFSVIGVFQTRPPIGGGGGDMTWMFDHKVWVPTHTFQLAFDPRRQFDEIAFRYPLAADGSMPDLKAIAVRMNTFLRSLHGGVHDFQFEALDKGMQVGEVVVQALGGIMFASGLVALLVGGVNVMNAQLVILHEKTREYGIRRALGLSASALRQNTLMESAIFTLVGGVLGVVFGLLAAYAFCAVMTSQLTRWPFSIKWWSVGLALGASMVTGLLAGWIPAKRASEIVPSECLRSD